MRSFRVSCSQFFLLRACVRSCVVLGAHQHCAPSDIPGEFDSRRHWSLTTQRTCDDTRLGSHEDPLKGGDRTLPQGLVTPCSHGASRVVRWCLRVIPRVHSSSPTCSNQEDFRKALPARVHSPVWLRSGPAASSEGCRCDDRRLPINKGIRPSERIGSGTMVSRYGRLQSLRWSWFTHGVGTGYTPCSLVLPPLALRGDSLLGSPTHIRVRRSQDTSGHDVPDGAPAQKYVTF